jgi:hypothetical protein
MNLTVFIACDFADKEPYRTLTGAVDSCSIPGSKVYPILSNTNNKVLLEAFGKDHADIQNGMLFSKKLGVKIKTLIKNCDFAIFDLSGYKDITLPANDAPLDGLEKRYCLNVIHEFGIATAFADDAARKDARFFFRKGLEPIKDISNLQGDLPLTSAAKTPEKRRQPLPRTPHRPRPLTLTVWRVISASLTSAGDAESRRTPSGVPGHQPEP